MKQTALLFTLVAAFAASARASQGPAVSLTSPLEFSGGVDGNSSTDRQRWDQGLLLLFPTTSLTADSRRKHFSLSYQPEFEAFRKSSNRNAVNHKADVEFTYDVSPRLVWTTRDAYWSSNDATRTLKNVFLFLPRGSVDQNAFRTELNFDVSPLTAIAAQFNNTRSKYGAFDGLTLPLLSTLGSSAVLAFSRTLNRTQKLRLAYSISRMKPLGDSSTASELVGGDTIATPVGAQSLTGDYRIDLAPDAVVEVGGGLLHTVSGFTYLLRVGADKRLGQFAVGGEYSRTLALYAGDTQQLSNALAPNELLEVATLRARGEPFRRLSFEAAVVAARAVSGLIVDGSRSGMATGRIDYRWSDRVSTFISAEAYRQNRNLYVDRPINRNRLFAGVQYSFSNGHKSINHVAANQPLPGRSRPFGRLE